MTRKKVTDPRVQYVFTQPEDDEFAGICSQCGETAHAPGKAKRSDCGESERQRPDAGRSWAAITGGFQALPHRQHGHR